jgi:CheY-like chemotaxis protein
MREEGTRTMADGETAPHVLLVEDDEDMRRVLARALRHAGCRVTTTGDGHEALAHLRPLAVPSLGARPDLVVTDVCLPGFSGLEVLETIRVLDRRIPVIVISAFMDPTMAEEARRLRATAFVTKPFDVEGFVADALQRLSDAAP